MADNVEITSGSGTVIRTKDHTAVETQVIAIDLNPAGAEALMAGKMPTQVASGDDVTLGATADVAVDTDAVGTVSAKLRGLVKMLADRLGNGTAAASHRVTIASDSTGQVKLAAGTAEIGKLAAGTAEIGKLAAGTAVIGSTKIATSAAGGWTPYHLIAAASMNATLVKNAAGQIGGWYISNHAVTWRYVKLFDHVDAPDPSSDSAAVKLNIAIPPGGAANVEFTQGIVFAAGIGFAITGAAADNDETVVVAGDVILNLLYV